MDDGPLQILMYVGFGIAAAVVAYFAWLADKKRREALIAFAAEYGWTLSLEKRRGGPGFPSEIFDRGHSRWTRRNMLKTIAKAIPGGPGNGSADAQAFEYHYAITSGSGKNRRTHHYYFTCLLLHVPIGLGRVFMRDEHFGDKFVQGIGFDDIDLEDPDFSSKFVVKASDRKDAYDLLGPSLMTFMRGWQGLIVQTNGADMLVSMKGRLDPHDVMHLERFMRGFLGNLPRLLVNNARVEAGMGPITEAGDVASYNS